MISIWERMEKEGFSRTKSQASVKSQGRDPNHNYMELDHEKTLQKCPELDQGG